MKYSKQIYSESVLRLAIDAYRSICTIDMSENSGYWIITFTGYEVEKALLEKEFSNYLIELFSGQTDI